MIGEKRAGMIKELLLLPCGPCGAVGDEVESAANALCASLSTTSIEMRSLVVQSFWFGEMPSRHVQSDTVKGFSKWKEAMERNIAILVRKRAELGR